MSRPFAGRPWGPARLGVLPPVTQGWGQGRDLPAVWQLQRTGNCQSFHFLLEFRLMIGRRARL